MQRAQKVECSPTLPVRILIQDLVDYCQRSSWAQALSGAMQKLPIPLLVEQMAHVRDDDEIAFIRGWPGRAKDVNAYRSELPG